VFALPTRVEGEVTTIGVDVLAEQGDLGDPGGCKLTDFIEQPAIRSADLFTPNSGNDAERTGVIAADLDGDPRMVTVFAARGQRGGKQIVIFGDRFVEDLGEWA